MRCTSEMKINREVMQKLYCYVDESGQDTSGRIFVVGVVAVLDEHQDEFTHLVNDIERKIGKHKKWSDSPDELNLAYMQQVILQIGELATGHFEIHHQPSNYMIATIETTINVITSYENYGKASVTIDGLPKLSAREAGVMLRKRGVNVYSVQGRADDYVTLLRLADAICGLVRDDRKADQAAQKILHAAMRRGVIREVNPK